MRGQCTATRTRATATTTAARLTLSTLIVSLLTALVVTNAHAAFDPLQNGAGRGFRSGHAVLTSEATGKTSLSLPNASPGDSTSSHVTVTYRGTNPVAVTLFGTAGGTGLDRFLELTVVRGTGTDRRFAPDPTDYAGAGSGVVYSGSLADFPDGASDGLKDPGGPWADGESHVYRFEVTMTGGNAAQGLTADQTFSWTARAV